MSQPLSAKYYIDEEFLLLERNSVFSHHWLCIGQVDKYKRGGDYTTGEFLGRPYFVVCGQDQQLRAFANVCLHHGSTILDGAGNAQKLVCPYHAWNYNLQGELIRTPGSQFINSCEKLKLKELNLKVLGQFLFLNFNEPKSSVNLEEALEPFDFNGFDFVEHRHYDIACNWKVFVDNYLDGGYHVPHMHKDLAGEIYLKSYASQMREGYNRQICTNKGNDPRLGQASNYTWVYPNLMINKYGPWIDTNIVIPTGPRSCRVEFAYYHQGPLSATDLRQSLEHSHQVQVEDEEVCLRVQKGLASGYYTQGYYVEEFESPMIQFHQMLLKDLEALNKQKRQPPEAAF